MVFRNTIYGIRYTVSLRLLVQRDMKSTMSRIVCTFCIVLGMCTTVAMAAERLTVRDCYALALQRSATVAIADEDIRRARARYTQALGTLLPQITATGTESLQQRAPNVGATSNVTESFTRQSRPEVAIGITQPLFQGLKELQAVRLAGADRVAQEQRRAEAARLLYKDVAAAFYLIARIEQEIHTTKRILHVLRSRAAELRSWTELGKARPSELSSQATDLALLEADLVKREGDRRVAYEMLTFLTGLDPHPPILATNPAREGWRSLEYYATYATQRPDVRATEASARASKSEVAARRADLLPHADASANYYPYRVGFQKDIHWDAKLTVSVPVLNVGALGQLKEAKAKVKQAELRAQHASLEAAHDIRTAYATARSSAQQADRYAAAVRMAERNWSQQAADYRLGLVTNLEVLTAQRTWLEALRLHDAARAQAWLDYAMLQTAAGIIP